MFTHAVLFEIQPKIVPVYRKDCRMWAAYAKKAKGFLGYLTLRRVNARNQYASVYKWKAKQDHDRFMGKFHDYLVSKSKAKVKVLGYYNLKAIDQIS